jgi:hypothetical protein
MAAGHYQRLWEMRDFVDVLEAWHTWKAANQQKPLR